MRPLDPRLARLAERHFGSVEQCRPEVRAFLDDVGLLLGEAPALAAPAEEGGRTSPKEEALRGASILLYRFDREGRFSLAEGGALAAMGRTSSELVGHLGLEVFRDHPPVVASLSRALAGERFTCLLPFPGGAILEASHVPVTDASGQYDGTVGVLIDVTEREHALAQLRESEALLRESQAVAKLGSYCLDIASGRWINSPALDEVFGIDASFPRTVEGWSSLVHPEDREGMARYLLEEVVGKRQRFDREYRVVRPSDGGVRWIHGLGKLEYGPGGEPSRMLGTIQDISTRRAAEQELWLKNWAVETALSAVTLSDLDGRITYANPTFLRWGGYSAEEVIGRHAREFAANPGEIERLVAHLRLHESWKGELTILRRDGSSFLVELWANLVRNQHGVPIAMLASTIDITERRASERELMQLKEQLAATLSALPDMLFAIDRARRIVDYHGPSDEQLYVPPNQFLGRRIAESLPPDVTSVVEGAVQEAFARGRSAGAMYALKHAGQWHWYELRAARQGGVDDPDARVITVVRDTTDRREIEDRLRLVVDAANDGVWDWNLAEKTSYVSARYREILGLGASDGFLADHEWRARVHPDDLDAAQTVARDCAEGLIPRFAMEYRMLHADGTYRWILSRGAGLRNPDGTMGRVVGTHTDVTARRQAEEELQRSEALLAEVVTVGQIGIFEHDHVRDVVYWSPEHRAHFGWTEDEPVTVRKIVEAAHPDDREHVHVAIRAAHDPAGDGRFAVAYRILHRDGSVRWIESRSRTFFEGTGASRRPVRTCGASFDITEQRRTAEALAESEERLRLALAAANQGLYDLDVQTGDAVVSPQYAMMLGYDPATFRETNAAWRDRMHPDDMESVYRTYTDYVAGRLPIYRVEFRQRTADGSWKWVLSLGKIVSYDAAGRPRRMLGTHTDITERKLAEQTTIRARDELEMRVAERTRQLSELNATLEEARLAAEAGSQAKSRFLAMMSHEIRTPLNGVVGVLHLLDKEPLSPTQRRRLAMANTSAATLLRVINDVLDFSKVEAGKLDLHVAPTDLVSVTHQTANTFAERAVAKGLTWSLSWDPAVPRQVATDGGRLAQILGNLLGNAVKFTESGSVALHVTRTASGPGQARVRFAVVDTGEGIAAEQMGRLFQPFSQLDNSSTRRHGGTGLGLGICKHLVELLGGTIGVESQPGQGSTFWFELLLSVIPPSPPPEDSSDTVDGTGSSAQEGSGPVGRALLAEDNEINQELASAMISVAGLECDCVTDGRAAVEAALSGRYQVLFMDCMMPVLDGLAATRAIREDEARRASGGAKVRRLPIVAMTANVLERDRAACMAAGMDDFLGKPLDPHEVLRCCRRWAPTSRDR